MLFIIDWEKMNLYPKLALASYEKETFVISSKLKLSMKYYVIAHSV